LVFGVGFSDSATAHGTYNALVILWQALNAPAGIYLLQASSPNWGIWCALQALTSFLWANAFAFGASFWKAARHNKPLEPMR
jgi:hypothetical protein